MSGKQNFLSIRSMVNKILEVKTGSKLLFYQQICAPTRQQMLFQIHEIYQETETEAIAHPYQVYYLVILVYFTVLGSYAALD